MKTQKSPSEVYKEIKAGKPTDLNYRVIEVLKNHIGKENRISRRDLLQKVFQADFSKSDLTRLHSDRMMRQAIVELQKVYPILSSSGTGGYWMAKSADEADQAINELISRAMKLLKRASSLTMAVRSINSNATQVSLFQEPKT